MSPMPSWKQISGEVGSISQPAREGLIRTVRLPNHVTMSITGRALKNEKIEEERTIFSIDFYETWTNYLYRHQGEMSPTKSL